MYNESPLFIVGVPRSGTTLLATILDQHTKIHVDKNALALRICRIFKKSQKQSPLDQEKKYIIDLLKKDSRLVKYFSLNQHKKNESIIQFINIQLKNIAKSNNKEIYVDKSPDAVEELEYLLSIFPSTKILALNRDPRANIKSLIQRQYLTLELASLKWREYNQKLLAIQKWIGDERFIFIPYEGLVEHPKSTIKKVCDFLNIEFEESMVELHKIEHLNNPKAYVQNKFDSSKIQDWKDKMSYKDIEFIESICFFPMNALGYTTTLTEAKARNPSYFQYWKWRVANSWKNLLITEKNVMSERKLIKVRNPLNKRLKQFIFIIITGILNPEIFISKRNQS